MPIPILQYEVQVRDPTTYQFSDLAALRGGQGPVGPGVPAGGVDGDVLVKNGATDYSGKWASTPPQMGSLATIEPTSTVTQKTQYVQGEYLVYNGQLYKVTATSISQGQTLNPGQGGNISAVSAMDALNQKTEVKTVTMTPTENVSYLGGTAVRIGKLVVIGFVLNTASGVNTWQDITLFTMSVTSVQNLTALAMTNGGKVFAVQVSVNSNALVLRTFDQSMSNSFSLRGTLFFVCQED